MRKVNLINRLFHADELEQQEKSFLEICSLVDDYRPIISALDCSTTLGEVMGVHKYACGHGYKNDDLGPDPYWMFCTSAIETMKDYEVFLGNVYGLSMHNIPFWEAHKDEVIGPNRFGIASEERCYDLILSFYRDYIRSNVTKLYLEARGKMYDYIQNGYIRLRQ